LVARTLGTPQAQASSRFRCYASPAYLEKHGAPRHPRELAARDCLVYGSTERGTKWTFLARKRRLLVPVRARVVCSSFFLLLDAAIAGHGITRLPAFF